jgi:phospholipid/cholesterol/gamma-HCH transport system substrate-binding protein
MATATPPRSPSAPLPPPDDLPLGPSRGRPAAPSRVARGLALSALGIVVLAIAYLLISGGGTTTYYVELPEAYELVRGDQVQVGGVPVGSVSNIVLTHRYTALVTLHVQSSVAPLHAGTVAEVRVPSLTSVADRYIALQLGPNNRPALPAGGTLRGSATRTVTDLDQLFDTFNPKTRKGLQQFIQGSAEQYAGAGRELGLSTEYFAPALESTDHIFAQLVSDQSTFTHFLIESSKALTTIAARKEDLSDLVEHADQTFQALGSQQSKLAEGLRQLPVTLAQGNKTFTELPPTLTALTNLFNAQKPNTAALTEVLTKLRPLVTTATPVVSDFSQAISRPGPNNDLTDFVRAMPELAEVLTTASPNGVRSLREAVPITAFFGPYSPDLVGTLNTFGQSTAYYDANGHYAHVSPVAPSFSLGEGETLTPSSAQQALAGLKTGQNRRCPGAATQPPADGSAPFTDDGALGCNPTQTP